MDTRLEFKKNVLLKKECPMCVKRKYDCNVVINKSLEFYDLKSNKRYIIFFELKHKILVFFIGM